MRLGLSRQLPAALVGIALGSWGFGVAWSAAPTVADALQYAPSFKGIEFDRPRPQDVEKCTIKAEKLGKATAWVVRGPDGAILRQFSDSNGDNIVDTFGYYYGGHEVYRDIDSNFNGHKDKFRWLNTAGTRIGVDRNEDGQIDAWQQISPEEAAAEAVSALVSSDLVRFRALLANEADIKQMGLADDVAAQLAKRIAGAEKAFIALAKQKKIDPKAEFTDFGGLRPGVVPAGTRGSTKDLIVYENVWAMMVNGDKHEQLQLGTIMRVGEAWKLADAPTLGDNEQLANGFFFSPNGPAAPTAPGGASGEQSEQMQKVLTAMEKLDDQMAQAAPAEMPGLVGKRADLLQKMAEIAPTRSEQEQWLRQLADTISAAIQGGQYPQGIDRLKKLETALAKSKASEPLLTHYEFRRLQAENGLRFNVPKPDHNKLQAEWLGQLEKFVNDHPKNEHAAEALLQLGMYSEFSNEEEEAIGWYTKLADGFIDAPNAAKAKGALTRLQCEGQSLDVAGTTIEAERVDLRSFRGKAVLLHYWSTAGSTSKADHAVIKDVYAKYGGKDFEVLGVNLDYDKKALQSYLEEHHLPWNQLFEEGGFESRLANEMGVIILPLFVLVGPDGKVVSNSLQAAELEPELKQILGSEGAARVSERRR